MLIYQIIITLIIWGTELLFCFERYRDNFIEKVLLNAFLCKCANIEMNAVYYGTKQKTDTMSVFFHRLEVFVMLLVWHKQ